MLCFCWGPQAPGSRGPGQGWLKTHLVTTSSGHPADASEAKPSQPRPLAPSGISPADGRPTHLQRRGHDLRRGAALVVLADHGGVLLLGTVLAAYGVPRTAFIVIGGHASDRWHPWTVMMGADTVRALVVAALAVTAAAGRPSPLTLIPIAVVLGVGEGLFLPGSFSIIPALLPDEDLQAGNGLASSGTQLATFVGPAIGGVLVALLGPATAFGLDAVTFAVSASTLAGVRAEQRRVASQRAQRVESPAARANLAPQAPTSGLIPNGDSPQPKLLHMLLSERVLQIILLTTLVANLGYGGESEVALPALAHGPFHAGAGGYGALIAVFGAGALVGTLVAGQARRPLRPAVVGSVAFLLEAVFVSLVPYLGGPFGAGAALVACGALNGFGIVITITAFQRWAPRGILGRLMGVLVLTSFGSFPVSVALGALAVHRFGPAPLFPIAGAGLAVATVFGLSQRSWREFGRAGPVAVTSPAP